MHYTQTQFIKEINPNKLPIKLERTTQLSIPTPEMKKKKKHENISNVKRQ